MHIMIGSHKFLLNNTPNIAENGPEPDEMLLEIFGLRVVLTSDDLSTIFDDIFQPLFRDYEIILGL